MPRLNITDPNFQRILNAGFTQAQFITWMKDNFAACGFPAPVETVGTNPKIIAYNLDLTATGGTADNYWYVIHIPTITNATNFTVTHGLFRFDRYNTTTFTRTASHIGAFDSQTTASQLPSASNISTLNNNNSYTAYNFPLSLEFKGVGIRANATGALLFFFGVTQPAVINSHIDRNNSGVLSLVTNISAVSITNGSDTYSYFPYPVAGLSSGNGTATVNPKTMVALFPFYLSHLSGGVEFITSFPYILSSQQGNVSAVIGKYSDDIAYAALGSFPFGTIIQITPGSEEYFVMVGANPGWAIRVQN